jgi:hypothetical protein
MESIRRLIISPAMLSGDDSDNFTGPSAILAPDWLPDRLGRYYLYFAHHCGRSIRLAFADRLSGPWTIHAPGTLRVEDLQGQWDHIASPDVHVDHAQRRIRMYFHGQRLGELQQHTYVAVSGNGIDFRSDGVPLADFYLKALPIGQGWIGLTKGGRAWASRTGLEPFRRLDCELFPMRDPQGNAPGDVRHVALERRGAELLVFFTRIGDAPEAIRCASVDLREPPQRWRTVDLGVVLRPESDWEGADLPPRPSRHGVSRERENGLRDPAIFVDVDGLRYLLYAAAGESGIGIATIGQSDRGTAGSPRQRVYVMGCGRSGTWLATALMSTFEGVQVFPHEAPVEAFARMRSHVDTLVLKRHDRAYETVEQIPGDIRIVWMVRHPYDVLTSHNSTSGREFHVTAHRWLGETLALQYLVDARRPGTLVLRYEDLVTNPAGVQRTLGDALSLRPCAPPDGFVSRFQASPAASAAMHGVRPIDAASIGRHRSDPGKVAALRRILPRLGRLLDWVAQTYGYDLTLP